jgi:hypothetical protein
MMRSNKRYWDKERLDPERSARLFKAHIKSRYGMSHEDYDRIWLEQGGRCPICESDLVKDHKKTVRGRARIDHCHATGKVRGILCNECNLAIGFFKEDTTAINRAAAYLAKHREPRLETQTTSEDSR